MLLDIGRDHALLPRGKPAANELLGRRAALLQAQQLMRQHTAERFEIVAIIRLGAFHQRRELLGRGKQSCIFEQEPRRERLIGCVGRHGLRVEIEEDHASRTPRLMPIALGAAGGNEDQLARHVAERGGRQTLDGRFAVAAHAMLEQRMRIGSSKPPGHRTIFEIEASESRYRNLIQFIPIPLWQVDARAAGQAFDGLRAQGVVDIGAYLSAHPELIELAKDTVVVSEANDDAARLFGAADKADLIRPVRYLFLATPDAARRVMTAHFEGRRNYVEEMKVRTLDGRTRDVMFLVTFPAPTEMLDTTLIIMLDITDRLEAEARLRRTEADFMHATRLATLGELVASIAHEVKQPLAAIVINAQTSLRWLGGADPNTLEASELISRTVSNAHTATDILQRIQSMAAKHEPVRAPTDINEVVEEALLLVRHESMDKAVNLNLALNRRLPKVLGDRVQLQQVTVNLW